MNSGQQDDLMVLYAAMSDIELMELLHQQNTLTDAARDVLRGA